MPSVKGVPRAMWAVSMILAGRVHLDADRHNSITGVRRRLAARRKHERFMDAISLPCPSEDLDARQIQRVNRLRRQLMRESGVTSVNAMVKKAMTSALNKANSAGQLDILEWGCGYDSLREDLPTGGQYLAVDIDRRVVAHQKKQGATCLTADEALRGLSRSSFDVIVSVFVFHFRLPALHVDKMVEVLRPDGFILANVYRRQAESRRVLREAFEQRGLRVLAVPDPSGCCDGNEFWIIGRDPAVRKHGEVGHLAAQEMPVPPSAGSA